MLHSFLKSNDIRSPPPKEDDLTAITIDNGTLQFTYENAVGYSIAIENAFNRFQIRSDGFLIEYYTMKGGAFLFLGFLLQFVGTLPI